MRKLKIYLDTPVISHLKADDVPDKMADTISLWQETKLGILKRKHFDDCSHIAAAIISQCDYVVSWNFKHMVNVKTVNGVRAVTNLLGYQNIDIIQPTMLIQGDDNDE